MTQYHYPDLPEVRYSQELKAFDFAKCCQCLGFNKVGQMRIESGDGSVALICRSCQEAEDVKCDPGPAASKNIFVHFSEQSDASA